MVVFIRHILYKYINSIMICLGFSVNFSCQLLKITNIVDDQNDYTFKQNSLITTENRKLLFVLNIWTRMQRQLVYRSLLNMYIFQQNKMNVSFRENVCLINRTPSMLKKEFCVILIILQQMKEIDHNADNFKYVLVIKKDGKTTRQEISDWTETQKEIDYGLVYTPFEIYVEAHNALGTYSRPAVIHIGYTGEDSE